MTLRWLREAALADAEGQALDGALKTIATLGRDIAPAGNREHAITG